MQIHKCYVSGYLHHEWEIVPLSMQEWKHLGHLWHIWLLCCGLRYRLINILQYLWNARLLRDLFDTPVHISFHSSFESYLLIPICHLYSIAFTNPGDAGILQCLSFCFIFVFKTTGTTKTLGTFYVNVAIAIYIWIYTTSTV